MNKFNLNQDIKEFNKTKLKKLNHDIKEFNKTELKNFLTKKKNNAEYNFEVIMKLIRNKNIIFLTNNLLNSLLDTEINKFKNKSFLSSFMIKYNYKEVFAWESDIEKELLNKSVLLLDSLNNIIQNLTKNSCDNFKNLFNEYITLFNKWKQKDANSLSNFLAISYKELEYTKNQVVESYSKEQKKNINKVINDQLKNIKKHGQYLDDNFNKKINDVKFTPVELKITSKIMEIAKDAYYDTIKDNFKNQKYDLLDKFLRELQERLIKLAPNNKKRTDEIKEKFDVDLIIQMVTYNAFKPANFIAWSDYLFELILSSQAAADDKETKEWKKNFDKICYDGTVEYHELIVKLLRFIMTRVEKIEKDIKAFKIIIEKTNKAKQI